MLGNNHNLNDIGLIAFIITMISGFFGGILNATKRLLILKKENITLQKIDVALIFIVDIITSAGLCVFSYIGLIGYGVDNLIALALAGVVAYQGTKVLTLIDTYLATKLNINLPISTKEDCIFSEKTKKKEENNTNE